MQNLMCPRGLQEDDFLELLRSTFPQLGSEEPLDFLISSSHKRLQLLQIEPRTPEAIYNAINAVGNSALYIRPKVGWSSYRQFIWDILTQHLHLLAHDFCFSVEQQLSQSALLLACRYFWVRWFSSKEVTFEIWFLLACKCL